MRSDFLKNQGSDLAQQSAAVDSWLLEDQLVSNLGAVAGAVGASGQVLYYYPEISGYYLSWLARYAVRLHSDASARAARILQHIGTGADAGPPMTLTGEHKWGDWRNNAVFMFDLAMLARGIGDCDKVFPTVATDRAAEAMCQWLTPFFKERAVLVPALYRRNDRTIPQRWSTNKGPYQFKALAALVEFSRAFGDRSREESALEFAAALRQHYSTDHNPHVHLPHPTLYASEGLLALGDSEEAAAYALPVLDAIDGALSSRISSDRELLRTDVLAQALRLCTSLEPAGSMPSQLSEELARRVFPPGLPGADPDQPSVVRVWAMLFLSEALHLLQGQSPVVGLGHV